MGTWTALLCVCVLAASCGGRPALEHDGPLVSLESGRTGGKPFEAFGFRRGDQGCVGWEHGNSRRESCSALLGADEAIADEQLAAQVDRILGRTGGGVIKIELVTASETLAPALRRGERESYFATPAPSSPITEVVLHGAAGVLRRYSCRDSGGYRPLQICLASNLGP